MNNRLDQCAFIEKCGFLFHFWSLQLFEPSYSSNWWYNMNDYHILRILCWPLHFLLVLLMTNKHHDCTDLCRQFLEGFLDISTDTPQTDDIHTQADFTSSVAFCLFTQSLGRSGTAGSVWIPISTPSFNIHAYPDQFRLTFSEELSDVSRSCDVFDAAGGSSSIIIKSYSLSTCCCCGSSISNKAWHSLSKSSSISSLRRQFGVIFWSI